MATEPALASAPSCYQYIPYHRPVGHVLAYGASYSDGTRKSLPASATSAAAAHRALVANCGFSASSSVLKVDKKVTASGIIEDVKRTGTLMSSGDVAVVVFSGHGVRKDDSTIVFDGTRDGAVSVRELQSTFAEATEEQGLRDVALVVILDCCQTMAAEGSDSASESVGCSCSWLFSLVGLVGVCVDEVTSRSDPQEQMHSIADADQCSWFVGFATSPGSFVAAAYMWTGLNPASYTTPSFVLRINRNTFVHRGWDAID